MTFEGLKAVEEFYKSYAHHSGFGVRIGQQRKLDNEIVRSKRYMRNREGFKSEKGNEIIDPSVKRHKNTATRCGCDAHIFVKLCVTDAYKIESWVEHHNHSLMSPDKHHLIRSNRQVSERAKNTLYTCNKASIGTCQAYRLLQVSEGGFSNVGCTKRDLQNYYRDLRYKIRNADAQMFVSQLARKHEANPSFFYDFVVSEEGKLMYVFWVDATTRKNYKHFGYVASFDSTYTTNQYDMIFAPFTGVNHHLQSVFFGAAFLLNEKAESYVWLFKTFLRAIGGVAPKLIITDEAGSIKNASAEVFPTTAHRLCMWHMMEKLPEKIGPSIREESEFWKRMNACVWGSGTPTEFESQWNSVISDFGLEDNKWLTLVEFWLRFDTALECQRQEELIADNSSIHRIPQLVTPWAMEKHGSEVFKYEVFEKFQKQIIASRDHCCVQGIAQDEGIKIVTFKTGARSVYDEQGNLLEEKPTDSLDAAARKKISTIRNKLEDLILRAKQSDEGMEFLKSSVFSIKEPLGKMVLTAVKHTRQEEYEAFIGCNIPTQVDIHPPNDVHSVGRCKRTKRGKEMNGEERKRKNKEANAKVAHLCKTCKQIAFTIVATVQAKKAMEKKP
ncbi:protein FAR1-RELATED SEQUENCE 5-like [Brachypodium distachyon]|uniref:protein FAR1-RELATED SEQUENCE 5-like n=1 Tax=Brachypodium distachyon TaxID=15368 RepID=UPI00052FF07C|nr:protein FAR1-RELATED SEQUENCE 5-like [Brachypodium distachyon]|eukprot:XP_010227160.1 protein FAR1-RELATED SEQUENCE 5-like [Brachypodium distachyon]